MLTLVKKYPFIIIASLVFLVCLLSYGKIVGMHFFLEDYLMLYSIQNPTSSDAGYGSGVFGRPYGYAVTPFIPFYYLFRLESRGYYFIELILYFFAALSVYFFAKTLTNSKRAAFGSSLIFASGYVGSSSLYRMAVGWQNLLAAIFLTLTVTLYYKYVKSSKIKLYLLAFTVYIFTSEFSFYRAHGIILLIIGIELLFNFKPLKSLVRITPFAISYWYFYVYSLPSMEQGSKIASFVQTVFTQKNYHFLLNPFITLENLFIPDKFNFPVLLFIVVILFILIWKKNKILIYCLIFAVGNYLVYFYNSPGSVQETTHRYLTVSFAGVATFLGLFLSQINKSNFKYLFLCLLIVALNLTLVRSEQIEIIQNRSKPAKEFWSSFQMKIPYLQKNSVIYIDSKQDGVSKPARDTAIGAGSMSATTSFATYYGLNWSDIYLAENFSELLSLIKKENINRDNIYTFFYSRQDGLVDTSAEIKSALFGNEISARIIDFTNTNVPFYSPHLLNFLAEINVDFSDVKYVKKDKIDLLSYLDFLTSREKYWTKVTATSTTEAEYAEIAYIKDQDKSTAWKGDDLAWEKNKQEEVTLNLGELRQIGAVSITPASLARAPVEYLYECSLDKISWKQLTVIEKEVKSIESFKDKFKEANCVFVKLTIYKTVSGGPPQISEIEVRESRFVDFDYTLAEEIEKDPFKYIKSTLDRQILFEYFTQNGISGKICVYTNRYKPLEPICKKYKFSLSNKEQGFFIDQGGTVIEKIEFLLPPQVKFDIKYAKLDSLSFTELEKMGYITKHAH
ncbi:hypothetical protein A3B39_00950 [Candidatus Daviesbacteria bacterium RIFCSPLOWO2_01_FULL_37_10]|nr:MAG: hypothetical protein A3B39_00950 [Candidatus Daviesbacteria bacterium RIFCSPLOWO2_01_FULL_37_10]